jgi:hypothetical protein
MHATWKSGAMTLPEPDMERLDNDNEEDAEVEVDTEL